ncbi:50S ribosomal protein L18 [Candidatus Falkowbacteria bacterium]|jgi:large subunit ribosomal protein L18|nr:50S ribosomal protein L18 [Candidatus Falkowbacteria bacterium]MBT4433010.1 50S ribosomal protein L18 [Candidatus Falkowbacteria bacterium]
MKDKNTIKQETRLRRHGKVRSKIFGDSQRPRLSVFRSNKYIFLQLIDDKNGKTLASVKDSEIKNIQKIKGKVKRAYEAGKLLAEKAKKADIKNVVFDRGGYKYHGRVKAVAEGARENGLKF